MMSGLHTVNCQDNICDYSETRHMTESVLYLFLSAQNGFPEAAVRSREGPEQGRGESFSVPLH